VATANPPKADIGTQPLNVRFVPILSQKSAMTGPSGWRELLELAAALHSLNNGNDITATELCNTDAKHAFRQTHWPWSQPAARLHEADSAIELCRYICWYSTFVREIAATHTAIFHQSRLGPDTKQTSDAIPIEEPGVERARGVGQAVSWLTAR